MNYFLNYFVDKKGQMIKKVKRETFAIKDITSLFTLFTTAPTMLKRNTTLSKQRILIKQRILAMALIPMRTQIRMIQMTKQHIDDGRHRQGNQHAHKPHQCCPCQH